MRKSDYFIVLMGMLFTGCHPSSYLNCRTEYLYPPYLASEQINTPDPWRACFYGQQLLVRWKLPKHCLGEGISLQVLMRYGTREIETIRIPVTKRSGWWMYRLINRDYWCRDGILSYKVYLLEGEEVMDQWTHYLWADIIEVSSE